MTETIESMPTRTDQQQFAQALVEQARSEGVELICPGGLLTGLTKTVLETALEAEITEHLGYDKHDPMGRNGGNSPQRDPTEDGAHRDRPGADRGAQGPGRQVRAGHRPEAATPPGRGRSDHPVALGARVDHRGDRAHFADVYRATVSKDTILRSPTVVSTSRSSPGGALTHGGRHR